MHTMTSFVHLPQVDGEFLQQLCAEQLITRRDRNGFPVRAWQKLRERNEALDAYVYARAAAAAAGLDRFEERHWRELERQLGVASPDPPAEGAPQGADPEATHPGGPGGADTRRAPRRVIRSRWLS
jgi:phage terminase large subunit GpA-like protein